MDNLYLKKRLEEAINKKDWNIVEDVIRYVMRDTPPESMIENEGSCFNNDDLPVGDNYEIHSQL